MLRRARLHFGLRWRNGGLRRLLPAAGRLQPFLRFGQPRGKGGRGYVSATFGASPASGRFASVNATCIGSPRRKAKNLTRDPG